MPATRPQLVAVYGSWHLGQLQVGLSKAKRLCRCSSMRITTSHMLPMQVRSPARHGLACYVALFLADAVHDVLSMSAPCIARTDIMTCPSLVEGSGCHGTHMC